MLEGSAVCADLEMSGLATEGLAWAFEEDELHHRNLKHMIIFANAHIDFGRVTRTPALTILPGLP